MKYFEVSIRITLPPDASALILQQKMKFVAEYGSKYKSAPHITLYLARYKEEGLEKLPIDLKGLVSSSFIFTLGNVKMVTSKSNFHYVMDVSNKKHFIEIHDKISKIASRYESELLRTSDQRRIKQGIPLEEWPFDPHITIGAILFNTPLPSLEEINKNLSLVIGKEIIVADLKVFFYGKENDNDEPAQLINEISLPLHKGL